MKALVIGATGATGKDLVQVLLQSPEYSEIVVFVRRATGLTNSKFVEVITDFDNMEKVADRIHGDVWFSLLGTTLKTAGSKDKQWKIDYEIPMKFAEIAKTNGVNKAVLLSAYGASTESRIFYSKMKGELEKGIEKLALSQLIIFRPGLLLRKDSDRFGERISAGVLKFLNGLGLIRKFKPMPTYTLAEKMAKAPTAFSEGMHVIELDKIFSL